MLYSRWYITSAQTITLAHLHCICHCHNCNLNPVLACLASKPPTLLCWSRGSLPVELPISLLLIASRHQHWSSSRLLLVVIVLPVQVPFIRCFWGSNTAGFWAQASLGLPARGINSLRQASPSRATKQLMPTPRGRRPPPTQGAGGHGAVEACYVAW